MFPGLAVFLAAGHVAVGVIGKDYSLEGDPKRRRGVDLGEEILSEIGQMDEEYQFPCLLLAVN